MATLMNRSMDECVKAEVRVLAAGLSGVAKVQWPMGVVPLAGATP